MEPEMTSLFEDETLELDGTLFTFAGAAELSQRVCGTDVDSKVDQSE